MAKLWGGRFQDRADALVEALGESVSFDARLAPWDIRGSIAHARMLGECKIISKSDARKIIAGLDEIAKEVAAGTFVFDASLEDVHTNIETALVRRIGDAGKRLHTARSRNDQIALDVRLWMRDQIDAVRELVRGLQRAFLDMGEAHLEIILPGCTHLQHAQPVLLAHHLLAYVEMLERDQERFGQLYKRVNVLPLGSAALAGTSYPIDRKMVARELGFARISGNSMDAVADRDHLIEFCANAAICMMHLSRWCEELTLWSTPEYGFIEIGDAFTTGSSIMPQKKNPDVAELVRGKTGRVYGDLMALLTVIKGLPLTYNRDLQEDKEPLFDACDTLRVCLSVLARMTPSIIVQGDRMRAAAQEGFMEATDVADYLAEKGVPFREAHEIVGRIVRYSIDHDKRLPELSLKEYQGFSPEFQGDILSRLTLNSMVSRRCHAGGTAPARVRAALRKARRVIDAGNG
ncbi:MAG TPA: argininosuccinate lyase [Candidatus Hydrogenedentes bacterium]|nr:argininosuccinate lyase [Candidatus Hydrogenedentota bacterium]HQE82875.1 argininosuccinate lyase [Candidatus Hydrogenedentota bacterium]HQH54388.1 argininosuccinate lyase [Candidatus Hydrogenedentota bacterium]HQM47407.1 argininosuccinate lyase [Candidatus Hydrogenedentota bacterium]